MARDGLLKIGDLAKRTGVPHGAIKHYLQQGLLPKPRKTSRNMAYYDPSCVERLRLIRELQQKRFLPLRVIKAILETADVSPTLNEVKAVLEIEGELFKALDHTPDFQPVSRKELLARTKLTQQELKALERMGLLSPVRDKKQVMYGEDDVRLVEALNSLRESGFTRAFGFDVEDIELYKEMAQLMVKKEMKMLSERVLGKLKPDELIGLLFGGFRHVNTVFSLLRKKMIFTELERIKKEGGYAKPELGNY